ncbi:uncharacterized protein ColSpa_07730 [Colletotrichum spaethianum]|uniref:LrgB-like family protein n=1 Tax=Colletotrichum spaethianum TaxID=700344 RepID=A0AA37UI85_9PEZI|nr:uncharacterized protein ColSpa_07730 [Colletotrichum spaethianum]GKT47549.1 hypothetical protein ColSpa_07730 [Colletotrichum spaethianum]
MITNVSARFKLLPLQFRRCLRHFTYNAPKVSTRMPLRMFQRGNDERNSSTSSRSRAWMTCGRPFVERMGRIFWVAVIYLASELVIWGLTLALRSVGLQFLSSIMGMVLVFALMVSISQLHPGSDSFYYHNVKSKVDFINSNLGVSFPVPIVTISKEQLLGGQGIGKVIGNFLNTNVIFWGLVFVLSWGILAGLLRLPPCSIRHLKTTEPEQPWLPKVTAASLPRIEMPPHTLSRRASETTTLNGTVTTGYHTDKETGLGPESRSVSAYFTDSDCPMPITPRYARGEQQACTSLSSSPHTDDSQNERSALASWVRECYPMALAISLFIVIGIPVSHITGDDRVLDGCMLWFVWISSTRLQRTFGRNHLLVDFPSMKTTATTVLNPVLLTTLIMTAYTRAKTAAQDVLIEHTLTVFSSGTSLSDLWTHRATGWDLRKGQRDWFGAGDAALSILECGIVVWGFKLYECRRQIWSRAGAAVVLISIGMAALNVFVSILLGSAVGLGGPEALAFAARSTTLALARPAMEALEGNQVVNAALVVSNGILGQLMYPFLLRKLRVEALDENETEDGEAKTDGALTIAAGAAIGINGAAMGVSYVYGRKSRAAPYAALSMTVFGVMTVVFTAVEPFTSTLVALAHR